MKMRIFGGRNLVATILIFTLLVYFCSGAESISSEVEDAEEDESEALGAEIAKALQDQSGLVKMMQFFDSLTENFSKIDQRMGNLERVVKDGKHELKKEMNERMDRLENIVKDGQEQLKNEIQSDVNEKNYALESVGALRHEQLRQEISLGKDDFVVSDAVASTITKLPQNPFRTFTDCGGNVELVRGAPSAIRFTNPGNNQRCVWTILPKVNFASTGIKFQSLGTEARLDGVRINYADSSANRQSQKVTELEFWIPIPTAHVIITFCPNPINVSSGFEASIHGFGTSGDVANNSKPSWFGNYTKTFDFSVSEVFADCISTEMPFKTSTDCGGNLELGRGAPTKIRFPNPGNNQSCAWKIVPKVNFSSLRIKFQPLGMATRVEDVRINYWDSNAKLQTQNVTELRSWISIPAPHVVITFCSNPSKVSSGFEASILGFGVSKDSANFKPSWFENSTATFDFSVSENFSQCIAIQMPLMTLKDCGGILELDRGAPSKIRFPNLSSNQSCVWTISPQQNFTSYRLKFLSLIDTETRVDGVRIHYLDSSANLQSQNVPEVGSWIPILAPFVLITFCSHPGQINSGFEASVLGFGSSGDAANNLKPSWFGNSTEILNMLVSQNIADCVPTEKYLTTSTDCGGLLGVADGVPSTIRYPNSGNYRSYDCCAWTLVPVEKFASFQMKFQSFGMDGLYDAVKIYYWNSTLELQLEKVTEFGTWISIPAPYAVITFCSDGSVEGGGFGASILGSGTSTDSAVFEPFWLTNRTETFSYLPGNSSTGSSKGMVSVVVQQPNGANRIVSLSVFQIGNDKINSYDLMCHLSESPNYSLLERSGGGSSSWATYQSSANNHPILVILISNSRNSGEIFSISY